MYTDQNITASCGFFLNLTHVLLKFCQPFLTPTSKLLLKIDCRYGAASATPESIAKYDTPLHLIGAEKHVTMVTKPDHSKCVCSGSNLHIFVPKFQGHVLTIGMRLLINENLGVLGFHDNAEIPLSLHIITDTRQIELLFEEIEAYSTPDLLPTKLETFEHHVKEASNHLNISISKLDLQLSDQDNSDLSSSLSRLHFIQCQLDNVLVCKNRRKYNVITQVMALKAHLMSPSCYRYLQSLDCLSLPHPKTLQQLYSKIGLESDFTSFLKQLTADFTSKERNLILHMDEIHVTSTVAYTGGRIVGYSLESDKPIKTVFAIMASSLSKKWSQVVRLLPCSSNSANDLFTVIKSVIFDIEHCDLTVRAICTDNYPLNVSLFKLFSADKRTLTPTVSHPNDPSRKLFLLFDFVHIIKSIRNNWLNLKDYDRTFTYPNPLIFPNFDDVNNIGRARFQDIRLLYKNEQSSLIKQAHRLTSKACWPTMLERQNVNLALKIFDTSTSAALAIYNAKHANSQSQTPEFLDIIIKVWKIFNVNTTHKHIRLNDDYSKPLEQNDARFTFLKLIANWLERWRCRQGKHGKLSPQTFTSFSHSCFALIEIVNHLTQYCGFDYVLTSRLQNDPIEHHFGLYRMMSGAQYHISYSRILESERRIKLSSMLKLFSKQQDTQYVSLKELFQSFSKLPDEQLESSLNIDLFLSVLKIIPNMPMDTSLLQSIAFVGGYAVHSYIRSSNCEACLSMLTQDKEMEIVDSEDQNKLIQLIDRGCLKWPSHIVIDVIIVVWKIFTAIENEKLLMLRFLSGPSRNILIKLATLYVEDTQSENWRNICSCCNRQGWPILHKISSIAANCILANKVRNANSMQREHMKSIHNRKLKKFKES